MTDPRRRLPGVDRLLESPEFEPLLDGYSRNRVLSITRQVLEGVREEVGNQGESAVPDHVDVYARRVEETLRALSTSSLRSVLNATGVIIHTNLGRSPLSRSAREAMARVGEGYSNLEFDLEEGERGSRYVHCVDLLRELTGAEDALVVNNNAAAVVLALNTVARDRKVLVSRGDLVEIGGGFRIPDILSRSGARLLEVGTTNRTRLADYREAAEGGDVAAILKVHRSNFRISGFTEEASMEELANLARDRDLSLLYDLGSGLLADPEVLGLPPEPRAPESLARGAHVVAISGDKLLGGPQAGILLGGRDHIGSMRKNPLTRAFRVDKVTLAGLEATLRHYLDPGEALREIPTLQMVSMDRDTLESRTLTLAGTLASLQQVQVEVVQGEGVVGGGTYPGVAIPGWVLRIRSPGFSAQTLARRLRESDPPVIGRREDQDLVLDLRTVNPTQDPLLARTLGEVLASLTKDWGSS